jgi:hypothetical protein
MARARNAATFSALLSGTVFDRDEVGSVPPPFVEGIEVPQANLAPLAVYVGGKPSSPRLLATITTMRNGFACSAR